MYKRLLLIAMMMSLYACKAKTGEELYTEGMRALQEGKAGSAIVLFKSALEKEQNNRDIRYQLAQAYVAVGKYETAEREYRKILVLEPSRPGLQLELARLYNRLGKPDQALVHAHAARAEAGDAAAPLEVLGNVYRLKAMPAEAEECYRQALDKEPDNSDVRCELADLALKQGRPQQARELLARLMAVSSPGVRAGCLYAEAGIALGRKAEARALYQRLAASHQDDPLPAYRGGLLDLEAGKTAAADAIATDITKRFPERAEGYRLRGFILFGRKAYREAIAQLQRANHLHPTVAGHYYLGLSLYGAGDLESALSQFRVIIDRAPLFTQARLMTAAILLQQHRLDDAVHEAKRLTDDSPQNALAYNLLGSAYMAKGRYEEGLSCLNRSIRLDPALIDTYLKKGMIHLSQGNIADVETDLATAVRVAPDVVTTRMLLSSLYLYRNNRPKALKILNEGLNGSSDDSALLTGMAAIMFGEKRAAEGVRLLEQARRKNPAATGPVFALAEHYVVQHEPERALSTYAEILKQHPTNLKALLGTATVLASMQRQQDALTYYMRARESHDPAAYLALCRFHEQQGRLESALQTGSEALGRYPRSLPLLEQQGRLLLKANRGDEALKLFDDVVAIAPETGLTLQVAAYQTMKQLPQALAAAKQAIRSKPEAAFGYQLLAALYVSQNRISEAIVELHTAVQRDRNNLQPALALARLLARSGDFTAALALCNEQIRRHPGAAQAQAIRAAIQVEAGKKQEAVKSYRAALSLAGNYLPALNNLAQLCNEDFCSRDEGLRLAEAAYAVGRNRPEVDDTLGYALLRKGQPAEALNYLQRAAAALTGNPSVSYHLALAHQELGNRQQAVRHLEAALQHADFKEEQQARHLLARLTP